jgi:hypothetical protein
MHIKPLDLLRSHTSNTHGTHAPTHLQHLDEGHAEIEVHKVAEVEGERHAEANWQYFPHIEVGGDLFLHIDDLEHLQGCTGGGGGSMGVSLSHHSVPYASTPQTPAQLPNGSPPT